MTKFLICILMPAVFLSSSCSPKSEHTATVEVIDGVEHVHNAETPLRPNKKVIFERELSIGSEDEAGNVLLYRPGWYAAGSHGELYIAERQDMEIKVFDSEGRFSSVIGRKGRGPGEFQNIGRLALLPDDRLLVSDWSENRISVFDKKGRFIDSHKTTASSFEVYFCTDSYYVREDMTHEPDGTDWGFKRRIFIRAYDYDGNEIFSYGEFQPSQSAFVKGRFSFSKPYDVHSILAGDRKNHRLYHCHSDEYLIEVFDPKGTLIRKIDRPYTRLPVTDHDKQEYLDGFRSRGSSEEDVALIEENAEMPKLKPVTERMMIDDRGTLWVELNEKKEGNARIFTAYDIFDENGIYEAKIWIDIRPGLFAEGKMFCVETDEETGYMEYKRYRVIWSDSE